MNRPFVQTGVALAATGSLLLGSGCSSAESGPRIENGIEFQYDVSEPPQDIGQDLGIDPSALPHEDVILNGSMYDENGQTTYHVVARAIKKDNRIEFVSHSDLEESTADVFQAALAGSEDLMGAATKRGQLEQVIFAKALSSDKDSTSHYNPIAKAATVLLDEKGVTFDELRATLRHELWHAVTVGLNFSRQEWETSYTEACDGLDKLYRPEALQYIERTVGELITLFSSNKREFGDEHNKFVPSLLNVEKYLESGRGAEDVFLYCGQLSIKYTLPDLEKKAEGIGENDFGDLGLISDSAAVGSLSNDDTLKRDIGREFIEGDTVYKRINESSYVKSQTRGAKHFGHSAEADNFDELFASILNSVTYYSKEFGQQVASMKPEEKKFINTFLGLTVKYVIAQNPSLEDKLTDARQAVLKNT